MGGCLICPKSNINKTESNDIILDKDDEKLIDDSSLSPQESLSKDDFQPLKLIGKGSFGKVILVKYINNNKIYAMKILKKEEIIKRNQITHTKTERFLLEKLDHPFIAKLKFAFQDSKHLYIITEFLQGGELYFHLKSRNNFKESTTKFYMAQIFLAIDYMHKNGYIYRDLKPENVLLDKKGYIKLTDFGLSKMVLNEDNLNNSRNTICGTLEYMAPEIIKGIPYGLSADWFSFGVVLYEMLTGHFPFELKSRNLEDRNFDEKDIEYPPKMSSEAKDLISKLLKIEPDKRLGYNSNEEIKNSDFFKDIDFEKLLKKEYKPPLKLKLNGELDLKYFDINLTEDNEIYSDSDSKNENEMRKTNDNKSEKNRNNKIQPFDEFSFYASDEKTNRNSSSDEEDFF